MAASSDGNVADRGTMVGIPRSSPGERVRLGVGRDQSVLPSGSVPRLAKLAAWLVGRDADRVRGAALFVPWNVGEPGAALRAGMFPRAAGACKRCVCAAAQGLAPDVGRVVRPPLERSSVTLRLEFLHAGDQCPDFACLRRLRIIFKISVESGDGFVKISGARIELAEVKLDHILVRMRRLRGKVKLLGGFLKLVGFNQSNPQVLVGCHQTGFQPYRLAQRRNSVCVSSRAIEGNAEVQ